MSCDVNRKALFSFAAFLFWRVKIKKKTSPLTRGSHYKLESTTLKFACFNVNANIRFNWSNSKLVGIVYAKNNHYTNRAFGAEDEARTRDPNLGKVVLYQLSYFRIINVGEDGFEPPKVKTSRFTVCPIWPLWYSPKILVELSSPEQTWTADPYIISVVL